MTRPGRTPGRTLAALLALAIGGCGIPFGSPDPAAVVCSRLTAVRAAAELGPRLRQAVSARDAEAALALASAIRRQVEQVPEQERIEDVFPPTYWDLARALDGAMFSYGFGARAAEKGFLERPWNEGDLTTALEMLTGGDESIPAVEAEVRELEANGQLPCAR